jgi:hypothetical protein
MYTCMYVDTTYIYLAILFDDAVSSLHFEYRNMRYKIMNKNEDRDRGTF